MTSRVRAALPAVAAACGLAYLAAMGSAPPALLAALKAVPVLCLAAWCWPGAAPWPLVPAGLLVSAAGDVLLALGHFLPGLLVFLVVHVLYTAEFLRQTRRLRLLRAVPFVLWMGAGFALIAPVLGRLLWPVAVYAAAIGVMMWRAAATLDRTGEVRREELWALAGAVLFGASDTVLALHRFMTPWPDAPYVLMVLYWAGQAALARSVRLASGIPAGFRYHHADPPAA